MDFIIHKLDGLIGVSKENSVEKQTLLRERIEYILYVFLGVLWNKNNANVTSIGKIIEDMNRMSIGEVVGAIRQLDDNHSLISKREFEKINIYPALRNQTMGHGYVHSDNEPRLEQQLIKLYNDLMELQFMKKKFDIICVQNMEHGKYVGIRFGEDGGGIPKKWACPVDILGQDMPAGSIYLLDGKGEYYRITPFVFVMNYGEDIYVFQSLMDKLSGMVKMSQMFKTGMREERVPELISISTESERRRISSNGTIMSYFDKNYSNFITVPVEKTIDHFLRTNRSNVQATVWGHGGVGKTACVQNICTKLFDDVYSKFSYIVFTSAKERCFDTSTGQILEINNLRKYEEIIDSLIAVLFDEESKETLEKKEERIISFTNKVLLVIDDYETFEDAEKEKIQEFIRRLNIDSFKVLLTTRNRRLSTGVEIVLDEFDLNGTKEFLINVFENEYPQYVDEIEKKLNDNTVLASIHDATSGRAIFLYQFANIYVQKGLDINLIDELKNSKNAQEFLYGKIYTYLSDYAKKAFECISQITEEKNLLFKMRVLEYILNDFEQDEITAAIQELVDQKVVEKYDEENYRVYSQDLFVMMQEYYTKEDQSYKDKIKAKIQTIGGINIKGTIYEAMLEEANNSRNQGNVKVTIEKYKRLLNDKKCEKSVKKRALINLTSYENITMLDLEGAIQVFDDYVTRCDFQNDVDILKLYTQCLWSSDDVAKAKACDILERFFAKKNHKKTAMPNLELFAMTVTYCSHNVMENIPDKVKISAEQRVYNEYGRELYEYVVKNKFSDFRPSIKHNVSIALITTAKLAIELSKQGYDHMQCVKDIIRYGKSNFNDLFKRQLIKIENEFRKKKYIEGDYVDAKIIYVARYGLLVTVNGVDKAIIHNTEMTYGFKKNLKRGETVRARVIGENEKGYILSLKPLEK